MLKYIYRAIILIAIFIGALTYFSRDIKEVVFDIDNTTTMSETTFPLVTIKTGDNTINLLHGYSSNLDANKIRESVTPLDHNKTFEVQIDQKDYDIKKLNYEVREFVGNTLIETNSVSVFENDGEYRTAKIKLQADLELEKEYAIKITLITSESKKMYYYQRIKIYGDAYLSDKLEFIMDFHNAIMNKDTAEEIIKYLEPLNTSDNSSYAYVNINSSFELVSWGNINPKVLTNVIPTVKEIYSDTASIELEYLVESEVSGQKEIYRITEFYRVRYSTDRMYLLNYERYMESIFDIAHASTAKSELKLGITGDKEVPYVAGEDGTKIAFVRNRELWFYNLEQNEATKVFSFRQENTDYIRDMYDQHDIRILNMDAEGNIDFMVYGYMNRGQYEGRVAIILYRFIRAEDRIEERVYIPVDEPYQSLKENMGELVYVNTNEVFYFHVYNTIYSYDLITKQLTEIAKKVSKDQVVVLKDINYVVWQDNADPKQSKSIHIMSLDTGKQDEITAKEGYNIRLMDKIDSNIIYGYVSVDDIGAMVDGSIMAPLTTVEIASVDKKILKTYSEPGYYVSGLEVKENIIELRRVKKVNQDGRMIYTFADLDHIMNNKKNTNPIINITSRVTEEALTQYYVALPGSFVMESLPQVKTSVNTVIAEDPTIRLPESEQSVLYYYPYITGGIENAYLNASDAIEVARERIGVVLNSNNEMIWERGVRKNSSTISKLENLNNIPTSGSSVENCIKILLDYQGVYTNKEQLSIKNSSAYDIMKKHSKYSPVRLTGVTLDDVFYYISKDRPVIAMTGLNDAVVIYGYDAFNIMVINPSTGRKIKMGIGDSAKLFEGAGNVFLSYLKE